MKTHLAVSTSALCDGQPMEALCGHEIARIQIVPLWDELETGAEMALSKIACCDTCWGELSLVSDDTRYVYGVIEKKKSRREEAEES